ncbi:TPA: hypothetical protein QDZ66_005044 [Pluralibacter gergoviae]|uniref:hypothetical protein n=1 Tax=Pluralibacter gergoviae TaxID=61647 RepID=UPI0012D3E41B|nr:hypothetical protein [Pluralibacter gergoviae]MBL3695709.1 hypothetical protein [Pluralibacter gergoviae]HDS1154188.1 hypothetical protein [Pluralibacter gergoviae]
MNKDELECIKELRQDSSVYSYQDKVLGVVRIKVIYRGERLYFQIKDRAIICIISARDAMLSKKSLKKWDSGEKIDSDEVELLCNTIQKYYAKSYSDELIIV